jgi:hypothetical protein
VYRLAVSHTFLYKKLDEFGEKHNANILEKVAAEGKRMEAEIAQQNKEPVAASENVKIVETPEPDAGRKIVFDNFDFKQNVHHMTEEHQNIDNHWVSHMCTENRVSGNNLSTVRPQLSAILSLDNGVFIPNEEEHILQRENYVTLVSQIIVRNIVCLHLLMRCAPKHIRHQYQTEMMKKTETVRFSLYLPINSMCLCY